MRVTVTGASGFLGGHVCEALEFAKHEVVKVRLRDGVPGEFPGETDAVVHLAAHCGGIGRNMLEPDLMFTANAWMAVGVPLACARADVHLVALGSVCAYPEHTPVPFVETNLWNGYPEPTNAPYGIAKRMLLESCKACGGPYTYLLPANLYGPRDHFDLEHSHVIPAMIRKFLEGEAGGYVELWGDGTPTRDFLYVEDCAFAIVKAVEHGPQAEPINLGTGVETSMRELAELIRTATEYTGRIGWNTEKPNGQLRRCLKINRAWEVYKWHATTTLKDGLAKTAKWYRSKYS